jgi:hypothetical protein
MLYTTLAAVRSQSVGPVALGLALGVLQWVLVVGVAAGLAAWRPAWRLHQLGMALCTASGALLLFQWMAAPWLARVPGTVFLAFPAGWVTLAFRDGVLGSAPAALAWAAPALAGALVWAVARRRLRSGYVVTEIRTYRPAAELLLEVRARQEVARERVGSPTQQAAAREDYLRSVPDANEDRVRNGAFLPVYDWSREGFLERVYMRLLTRRERIVAELMMGPRLRLTRKWINAAGLALLGVALSLGVPGVPQGVLLVLAGLFGMTAFHGGWPGFQLVASAGKFMPVYAVQPVEYREISRLFFKMTLLRILTWAPLAAAIGAALGHRAPLLGATAGLAIGLKTAWILLSIQPVAMVARFSSGSTDTERISFRGCFGLILPFLLLGIPGLGGVICTFALPQTWWLLGAGAVPLSAWALWAFYGMLYNRGRIDLIRSTAGAAG